MLKLGYFHGNFSGSETFIYDLVKSLSIDNDINLTYISSSKTVTADFDLNCIHAGYGSQYDNNKIALWIYRIGQVLGGRGSYFELNFRKKNVKYILNRTNIPKLDVGYVEYATAGVLLMDYFCEKKIPFIIHVHGFDVTCSLNDKTYTKQLNILFEKVKYIITPSNHVKRVLVTLGCESDKIIVIYPITSLPVVKNNLWEERLNNQQMVTFLGRLTPKKNPLALLHAFQIVSKNCPDAKFTIIGDGPLKNDVISRIKKLNLEDKVILTGAINRIEAFEYLKKTWVYAQHSVTSTSGDQEGFPVSLVEAAAHSLPLVSTIHSGITENVIHNETGYLVQEYDYESMAERIIYLLKNPEIAQKIGENGRTHILNLCATNNRTEKIKDLMFKCANLHY